MYSQRVDVTQQNTAYSAIYRYVLDTFSCDKKILEIGDETGEFGELFADRGYDVTLATNNQQQASIASTRNLTVIDAQLDKDSWPEYLRNAFDIVILWLTDTELTKAIRTTTEALTPGGILLVVAKNSLHGSRRIANLAGFEIPTGFDYIGLPSLTKSLTTAGFNIDKAYSVVKEVLENDFHGSANLVPENVVDWVRHQPQSMDSEFILICSHSQTDIREIADIEPLIPYPKVEDKFTQSARLLRTEAIHGNLRDAELERLRKRESELLHLANELKLKEQIIRNDAQYKDTLEQRITEITQSREKTVVTKLKEEALKLFRLIKRHLR